MRRARRSSTIILLVLGISTASPGAQLDYRSWDEGALVMIAQSILYDEAKLYDIGESSTPGIYQLAMLISEDAEVEDGGTKNAVLFECGMHSREWFPAESCYWLIDYLLRNRRTADVRELLSHVDVWVIPQTNPAGRDLDDLAHGDPTQFAYVCDIGANAGKPCSSDTDCPGGGCWKTGWRGNAGTGSCALGIDLARNFSSGWDMASSVCLAQKVCRGGAGYTTTACSDSGDCSAGEDCKNVRMHFRGPDPFSEPESLNLRRFVHNHMLSMVTIVHSNSHELWHRWRAVNQASWYLTSQLLAINVAGSAAYAPSPAMFIDSVGGGFGQFSAWLTSESNVAGELDLGTRRNISTFYFELPVRGGDYGSPYQHAAGDNSNSFHPSSDTMEDLWEDAIRDMFRYVIRQARSPVCPIDDTGNRVTGQCENDDFGLVGAKIADATDEPGLLEYDANTREELLEYGAHEIVFAVQNFSASASTAATTATVEITKDGGLDASYPVAVSLAGGDRATYSVSHTFSMNATYRVEIELDPDDFHRNNTKIFAFRVLDAWPFWRKIVIGWSKTWISERKEGIADDRLRFKGKFVLRQAPQPEQTGLNLLVRGYPPHAPSQLQNSAPVGYQLPSGSPWWDKSKPEKGRWVYSDRKGALGPVKKLLIKQRIDKKTGNRLTKVAVKMTDADLSSLAEARSYTVDIDLISDGLLLSSTSVRKSTKLPDKLLPPDEETEEEPDFGQ